MAPVPKGVWFLGYCRVYYLPRLFIFSPQKLRRRRRNDHYAFCVSFYWFTLVVGAFVQHCLACTQMRTFVKMHVRLLLHCAFSGETLTQRSACTNWMFFLYLWVWVLNAASHSILYHENLQLVYHLSCVYLLWHAVLNYVLFSCDLVWQRKMKMNAMMDLVRLSACLVLLLQSEGGITLQKWCTFVMHFRHVLW